MNTNITPKKDKRANIRLPSSRPIVLIMNKQHIYATMTDFSCEGIGFIASVKPNINSHVEVHFDISENPQNTLYHSFQFKAEVVHCIELYEEHHIGIKLDFPTKEYIGLFNKVSQQ